ncbi:MAG: putative polyprenyl diphosphate synthase [Ilumatobacteraceae bacterium]|nr:putative polyprenyl diphosphate synthase [Ilumatobacteraceae bacterium]
MSSTPFFSLPGMELDRRRIEDALVAAVDTKDPYLNELARHLIVAGGKRLRPVLSVCAAQVASPGPVADAVVQGGIACELVQTGSLYHDDVIDESETRRGVETVNAKWGNLQAILAGDFLLARASEIAASLGAEVAGLLGHTIARLCEGEIEQLRHTYKPDRPEDAYFSSIAGKTASLFSTAARIGGIVAGIDRASVDALTAYGLAYGMVFQIVDDILDITATDDQLGKPAGHDMVEGVYTLPVLHTLAGSGVAADELGDLLGGPLDPVVRDKALSIVRSGDGVRYSIQAAGRYVQAASDACDLLPPGPVVEALRAAPQALLDDVS